MKRSKFFLVGAAILLLLFSALAISSFLGMLHQGENKLLIGKIVFFSAYLSISFFLLAAVAAFWRLDVCLRILAASFFLALPSYSFAFYPALWCEFTHCSDVENWLIVWDALLLPTLVIIAGLLVKRASKL